MSQRHLYGYVLEQPKNNQSQNRHGNPSENKIPGQKNGAKDTSAVIIKPEVHLQYDDPSKGSNQSIVMSAPSIPKEHRYESAVFGLNSSPDKEIHDLFHHLQSLPAMDKYGSMSGDCDYETTQMEDFLSEAFKFKSLPGKYIVHGVKAFELNEPVHRMKPNKVIRFPKKNTAAVNSFLMTAEEIQIWQKSYAVYAEQGQAGMTNEFLKRALQGHSECGPEAFLMKFVVRISQCPILMEFDSKIIPRPLHESWPNKIKLVSVTGIDFAGRIHDVDDIRTYVVNWREVYEIDRTRDLPVVYNGRDFYLRANAPRGQLDEHRLLRDLIRMARLRLRACNREDVRIVVETGIGLGVFAGKYIGIDETVRRLSAQAIRTVLDQDGASYRNIRAIVFALPIFGKDSRNGRREEPYQAFVEEFQRVQYRGPIPVLIADQDMHRLTVAIARRGFTVSELNPADSHGVFGEYWQNRGPAVEEKLALTTVGLLVQHHLINPCVLDTSHYHFI